MSYALKTAGSSTLAMLAAAALGLVCLEGLAAASPSGSVSRGFVVVASVSGDRMQVYKADPRTLKRISPEVSLALVPEPATRPRFPMTWAMSPGRKQVALSIERELSQMELEVIDLTTMKLLRSLRTGVSPIVWPSPHRLVGLEPHPESLVAIDPQTGDVLQSIPRPNRVPPSENGALVETGELGGPVRVLRLDAPNAFRVATFPRLRRGIEPFLGGGGRLPPRAKLAVARAQAAAGGKAQLTAVAPFLAGDGGFGCTGGGIAVPTSGYRVVVRESGGPVEYRVGGTSSSDTYTVRCDARFTEPLPPAANMLTAPRPTWYVTEPQFALERTGALVALTTTVVARQSARPLRTRYQALRPGLPSVWQVASVRPGWLVATDLGRVWLLSTRTGRTLELRGGDAVAASGGRVVVRDRYGDGGIVVFGPTGRLRFHALKGRQVGDLQVFGGYAYVSVGAARRVVSLESGRIVGRVPYGETPLLPTLP